MLSELIIQVIVDDAMNAFATEHNGKKGWDKKDIMERIIHYGGNDEDYRRARVMAVKLMMDSAQIKYYFN